METECNQAYNRIRNGDYEKDDRWKLTPAGQAQFKRDAKLLREHLGYDVTEMVRQIYIFHTIHLLYQ